jgi:hypothetical protein
MGDGRVRRKFVPDGGEVRARVNREAHKAKMVRYRKRRKEREAAEAMARAQADEDEAAMDRLRINDKGPEDE